MSKHLNNINLNLFELQNAKLHILASAPTGYEGLVYFNSTTFKAGLYANSGWKYFLTDNLLGAVSGVATLDGSSKVVQDPASAATTSGGSTGKIPISSTGGKLDVSYIPTLNNIPAPTAAVAMNSQAITGLLDPTNPQDAATKNYVDLGIQGLNLRTEAIVASVGANITKTGTQTIDTQVLIVGDRVLLKDQTAPAENGIWVVAAGAWTRATDYDSWSELVRSYVFITGGSATKGIGYVCTVAAGGTLNSTAVTYSQFTSAVSVGGSNVGTGTGNIFRDMSGSTVNFKTLKVGSTKVTISNNADNVTIDIAPSVFFAGAALTGACTSSGTLNKYTFTPPATAATLTLADNSTFQTIGGYTCAITCSAATAVTLPTSGTLLSTAAAVTTGQGGTGSGTVAGAKTNLGFMTRFAADIGNGSLTSIPVTHSLNTLDVIMECHLKSTGEKVYPDMFATDVNTATFVFGTAPTSNQYRVVIIG